MIEYIKYINYLYSKILTIINVNKINITNKIKYNNKIIIKYNNLNKYLLSTKKRNEYKNKLKVKSARELKKISISLHFNYLKYIRYFYSEIIDSSLSYNIIDLRNSFKNVTNKSNILIIIPVDIISENSINVSIHDKYLSKFTSNVSYVKIQQPLKNNKEYFEIEQQMNNTRIHIKTNKYTKSFLLELKKMNLQKMNIFYILNHISYKNIGYLSEYKSHIETFYHFLLSCIFCNIGAQSSFIIRIGISSMSYELIFLLNKFYDYITIISHKYKIPTDSQLYITCINFKGISDEEFNNLLDLYEKWCKVQPYLGFYINSHNKEDREKFRIIKEIDKSDNTQFAESIFDEEIPKDFVNKINNHISRLLDRQLKYYEYFEWFQKNEKSINMKEFDKFKKKLAIQCFIEYNIPIKPIYSNIIYNLLTTQQLEDKQGKFIKLHSNIKRDEGEYIYYLIRQNKLKICVEVGMAYGVSALFICRALKNNESESSEDVDHLLYSIDPNQSTQWLGLGVENIKRDNLTKYHKLLEMKSYRALPKLLKKYEKEVDMIFIDGWHTFDYTLVDGFYSDLLLKIGGYMIFDDALHQGPAKVIRYMVENYKHYKKLDINVRTIAVFKKLRHDDREWSYHRDF